MGGTATRRVSAPVEYRKLEANEHPALIRFFRDAGFPVALMERDEGWGAWSHGTLVGCIALCHEARTWILRGPEVRDPFRRRGVGAELLKAAEPEFQRHPCYCVAYPYLLRMYLKSGFRPCPPAEQPRFLASRVQRLRETGWDLVVLRRVPQPPPESPA